MNTIERLTRARIQIQKRSPFFAYLSLFLKFQEGKDLPEYAGAGVNAKGDFYYRNEFFEKLNDEEIIGVVVHEILHLSFLHLLRVGSRDRRVWNVACDIAVNQLIKDNNFRLPRDCIVSDYSNRIKIMGQTIEDCDKKNAEEFYDILSAGVPEQKQKRKGKGTGQGSADNGDDEDNEKNKWEEDKKGFSGDERFDEHIEEKNMTEEQKKKVADDWTSKVIEAYTYAKMRGDVPMGIERYMGKIHASKVNWRALLQRYILSYIPIDYTYQRPNKKSVSAGYYMPDVTRDKIQIVVTLDLSGSIGEQELKDFLSEIIGIAKGFREKIDIRFLTHDVEVQNDYSVYNGNVEKIKKLKIKGGGGTSHKLVFDYIKNKIRDCKVVVMFTDGYSDLNEIDFKKYNFDKIVLLSHGGNEEQIKGRCRIIKCKN